MVSWSVIHLFYTRLPFHSRRMTEMTTAPGDGLFYVSLKSSHPRPPRWCRATPCIITVSTNVQPASGPSYGEGFPRPRHDGDAQHLSCFGHSTTSCATADGRGLLPVPPSQVKSSSPACASRSPSCDRPPQTWPGKGHAALEDWYQYSRWWISLYSYHLGVFRRLAPGKKETIFSWPEMYAIIRETNENGIVIGCILSLTACISSKLVLHK